MKTSLIKKIANLDQLGNEVIRFGIVVSIASSYSRFFSAWCHQAAFTLCKLMEYHNSEQAQVLEPGTMKNYFTTQKYLKEFIRERFNTNDKYLSELSYKFITDFEYFLRNRKPEKGQKALENNGLMEHSERFCKMVNLAVRLE